MGVINGCVGIQVYTPRATLPGGHREVCSDETGSKLSETSSKKVSLWVDSHRGPVIDSLPDKSYWLSCDD